MSWDNTYVVSTCIGGGFIAVISAHDIDYLLYYILLYVLYCYHFYGRNNSDDYLPYRLVSPLISHTSVTHYQTLLLYQTVQCRHYSSVIHYQTEIIRGDLFYYRSEKISSPNYPLPLHFYPVIFSSHSLLHLL